MHNDSPHKKLFDTGAIVSLRLALAIVMVFNLMPYQSTSAAETLFEATNNGKIIPVISLSKNPRAFFCESSPKFTHRSAHLFSTSTPATGVS